MHGRQTKRIYIYPVEHYGDKDYAIFIMDVDIPVDEGGIIIPIRPVGIDPQFRYTIED